MYGHTCTCCLTGDRNVQQSYYRDLVHVCGCNCSCDCSAWPLPRVFRRHRCLWRHCHQRTRHDVQVLGASLCGGDGSSWDKLITDLAEGGSAHMNHTDNIRRICEPSYVALPLSLKRCFVTFAAFREDSRVKLKDLTSLWATFEPVARMADLETARQRLHDLVAACLVLEERVSLFGNDFEERAYSVHDIMRDLAVAHAREWGCDVEETDRVRPRFAVSRKSAAWLCSTTTYLISPNSPNLVYTADHMKFCILQQ